MPMPFPIATASMTQHSPHGHDPLAKPSLPTIPTSSHQRTPSDWDPSDLGRLFERLSLASRHTSALAEDTTSSVQPSSEGIHLTVDDSPDHTAHEQLLDVLYHKPLVTDLIHYYFYRFGTVNPRLHAKQFLARVAGSNPDPLLLNCTLAQAVRYCEIDQVRQLPLFETGLVYYRQAQNHIFTALEHPSPNHPAALVEMASLAFSLGALDDAALYSSLAVRVLHQLALHLTDAPPSVGRHDDQALSHPARWDREHDRIQFWATVNYEFLAAAFTYEAPAADLEISCVQFPNLANLDPRPSETATGDAVRLSSSSGEYIRPPRTLLVASPHLGMLMHPYSLMLTKLASCITRLCAQRDQIQAFPERDVLALYQEMQQWYRQLPAELSMPSVAILPQIGSPDVWVPCMQRVFLQCQFYALVITLLVAFADTTHIGSTNPSTSSESNDANQYCQGLAWSYLEMFCHQILPVLNALPTYRRHPDTTLCLLAICKVMLLSSMRSRVKTILNSSSTPQSYLAYLVHWARQHASYYTHLAEIVDS
ncbi:hypothetical protein H4R34_003551 [Dimargaris verticillata]|uniref:Xylanolytic transcriptional activator regulatory domain-containing protein n=1 Tax=Dimargaris verticillata TaxID=2761393 RepID=A0A9W8B608_9FUNG|nr:hypothetical protein H4R34_003551 [Dimargaris verticillata]